MSNDTIVLTRKIQLIIDSTDQTIVHDCFQKLYSWQHICFRAANYIFTHHFIQEQLKDLFYLSEGIKVKLADIRKDKDGILTTSRANTTYQVLSDKFKGKIPMDIITSLNHSLVSNFNAEKQAYWNGEKSLRNYKRGIPMPFSAKSVLPLTSNGQYFSFNWFGIPFKTYLGKDFYDKRVLLEQVMAGTVKLCGSSLVIRNNKIFFLASFEIKKDAKKLNENIIAEATLSIECPISVKVNQNKYHIGTRDEFLYKRLAIQAARQRAQKNAVFNRSGKGRKRKLKNVSRYNEAEKNYVNNKLHLYSRRLIDICIKHQAGSLLLTNQQQTEEAIKEDEFLLRNWSFLNLKEKILYKANKAGINVIIE